MPTTQLAVGQSITSLEMMETLPEGTILKTSSTHINSANLDHRWVREGDGLRRLNHGSTDSVEHCSTWLTNGYFVIESLPIPRIGVGERIPNQSPSSVYEEFPVGTVVDVPGAGRFTKVGANTWDNGRECVRTDSGMATYLGVTIAGVPGVEEAPTIEPWTVLTQEQTANLPVGSRLTFARGRPWYWERREDGWAHSSGVPTGQQTLPGGWILMPTEGPEHVAEETAAPVRTLVHPVTEGMTLTQYIQRFATVTRGKSIANSKPRVAVEQGLGQLGVEEPPLSAGMVVNGADSVLREQLPVGTTVRVSGSTFGLTEYQGWVRLTGRRHEASCDEDTEWVVIHIPNSGTALWVEEPVTEESKYEIDEFKTRALEAGRVAQARHSYCGVFESTMEALDIDPETNPRD